MSGAPPAEGRLVYGQCWEDADRLVEALAPLAGRRVLSIASGGENSLALLAEGPERLIALDRNPAQLAALELKAAACACLAHGELMVLLGAWDRPEGPEEGFAARDGVAARVPAAVAVRRMALYRRCRDRLSPATAAFWDAQPAALATGLLAAGRFERYLARFRRWLLPLLRDREGWRPLLAGLGEAERRAWFADRRDRWRWRLLFRLYFCRASLGRLGTDPAQVRFGAGSQDGLLLERLAQVLTDLDPADNPYLHWILLGRYGAALPRALRPESLERIRPHLPRLELRPLALEDWLAGGEGGGGPAAGAGGDGLIDRFNLSNVFEYQSEAATTRLLGALHHRAAAGARLVCWNRLAERDERLAPARTWAGRPERAEALHRRDRVFFYRRLVVAEAIPTRFERTEAAADAAGAQEGWRAVRQGRELARLALWWRQTPPLAEGRLGAIGGLSSSDPEAAAALLRRACARLAEVGCTRVLAPMDGSTWGAYRCRLDPPLGFPGEPLPGPEWGEILAACGFREEARYLTSRCDDLALRRAAPRARRRLAGLAIRAGADLDPEDLLPALHPLILEAFRHQPWFLPLPPDAFAGAVRRRLAEDPEGFSLLAFDAGVPVGLLLAQRAQDRLVVRSLAVRPGRRLAGLGTLLLEEAHRRGRAAGCRSALHVLMHASGPSIALSRHYARPVARYVLLGRRLAPGPTPEPEPEPSPDPDP